jgi:hypothetical protein
MIMNPLTDVTMNPEARPNDQHEELEMCIYRDSSVAERLLPFFPPPSPLALSLSRYRPWRI